MNHSIPRQAQQGFTLVELLVVILIIGILAAIALPVFLRQRQEGQDARAKSDARNMVSQIEACFQAAAGFTGCTDQLTAAETGLDIGTDPGQVAIVDETSTGYKITAVSEADTGGVNHSFTIVHNIGGVFARTCDVDGQGGCQPDGTW